MDHLHFISRNNSSPRTYKACSKKDRTFAIKILLLILRHFKHCPLQSGPLYCSRFFLCWNASWNAPSVTTRSSPIAFSWLFSLSPIQRTACARAQFSRCSSMTNAHSETGQMAFCCQNLTLAALSSRSALSVLVGTLFKKFSLFFEHLSYVTINHSNTNLLHKSVSFWWRNITPKPITSMDFSFT
jgi:hypothetical protein